MSVRVWCGSIVGCAFVDRPLPPTLSHDEGAERLQIILAMMRGIHPDWSLIGPLDDPEHEFPSWELLDHHGNLAARYRLVRD